MVLNMTNREKRCEDCASLVKVNGCWCCDECLNQKCMNECEYDDSKRKPGNCRAFSMMVIAQYP